MAFTSVLAVILRFYLAHENSLRDREQEGKPTLHNAAQDGFLDLTDKENRSVGLYTLCSNSYNDLCALPGHSDTRTRYFWYSTVNK